MNKHKMYIINLTPDCLLVEHKIRLEIGKTCSVRSVYVNSTVNHRFLVKHLKYNKTNQNKSKSSYLNIFTHTYHFDGNLDQIK